MTTRHERQRDVRDRAYVGDGVYVSHDGGQLWLTTEDGRGRLHEIALAPEVLEQLMNYRTFLRKRSMAGAAAGGHDVKVRAQLGTVEYYSIVAVLGLILIAMAGIAVRQRSTERRVSALESKPCLLTGAHVGCERGSAR